MVKIIIARLLEQGINKFLNVDPPQQNVLKKHNGKVLQVKIKDINQSCYFLIINGHLHVYSIFSDPVDTYVSGSLFALLSQIKPNNINNSLVIEGDMELAQDIQSIIQGFNLNWEEYLSYLIGDVPTYRIANFWQSMTKAANHHIKRFNEDVLDYLQEEKKLIPCREEVEDFYTEITALSHRLDRLEARSHRLTEK